MSEVVSVRIRKETKRTLEENGVDIASAVRDYLDELSWKVRSKEEVKRLHDLIDRNVKPSKTGAAARSVREDRDHGH